MDMHVGMHEVGYATHTVTLTLQKEQQNLQQERCQQTDHQDLSLENVWDHHSPYPHSPEDIYNYNNDRN